MRKAARLHSCCRYKRALGTELNTIKLRPQWLFFSVRSPVPQRSAQIRSQRLLSFFVKHQHGQYYRHYRWNINIHACLHRTDPFRGKIPEQEPYRTCKESQKQEVGKHFLFHHKFWLPGSFPLDQHRDQKENSIKIKNATARNQSCTPRSERIVNSGDLLSSCRRNAHRYIRDCHCHSYCSIPSSSLII